jgi:hypothetical protein
LEQYFKSAMPKKAKAQDVDRSGAPPTKGVNKGLELADRFTKAPPSELARSRKLRINTPVGG